MFLSVVFSWVTLSLNALADPCSSFLIQIQIQQGTGTKTFQHLGSSVTAAAEKGPVRFDLVSQSIPHHETASVEAEGVIPTLLKTAMEPSLQRKAQERSSKPNTDVTGIDEPGHHYLELSTEGDLLLLRINVLGITSFEGNTLRLHASEAVPVVVDEGTWSGFLSGQALRFHVSPRGQAILTEAARRVLAVGIEKAAQGLGTAFEPFGPATATAEVHELTVHGTQRFRAQGDTITAETSDATIGVNLRVTLPESQ